MKKIKCTYRLIYFNEVGFLDIDKQQSLKTKKSLYICISKDY